MKYLLDTNTVIHYLKGMGEVANRLLATPPAEIAVSTITLFELEVGISHSSAAQKRRRQFASLVSLIRVMPFGEDEARAAAAIRARLEKGDHPLGPLDTLIAGTARANHLILITRDVKDFRHIRGLQVETWY